MKNNTLLPPKKPNRIFMASRKSLCSKDLRTFLKNKQTWHGYCYIVYDISINLGG